MLRPQLISKLQNKSATIGVVGLGYVGLPLLLRFSEVGYPVIGFDIDERKVSELNQGHSYIEHISSGAVREAVQSGFIATTGLAVSGEKA